MNTAHHLAEVPPLDAINLLIHLGNLDVPVWTAAQKRSQEGAHR